MKFFLGIHRPDWMCRLSMPLFVSHMTLRRYKRRLPWPLGKWALDSGGFSELSLRGAWTISPAEYVAAVRRYNEEMRGLLWAAPQDWMCEPFIIGKTGLSVEIHQQRTVSNYLELRSLAPELPFIPVLQGYTLDDYMRCREAYDYAGIDLTQLPLVGIGSVCRRQHTEEIQQITKTFSREGIKLHGFGIKLLGRELLKEHLVSSDSMAWSYTARRAAPLKGCSHKNCANCLVYAERWYWKMAGFNGN